MSQEREALRAEVEQLRRQLESIQESHASEVTQLKADLEESNAAKESAEEQYQNLLGRVEKIKQTLSDRLRRDKAELEEAKERIEELEAQNDELRNTAVSSGEDVSKLKEDLQDATRELNTLRSRNNLSAQNWNKEKEELVRQVQHLKEEMETTANAMGEWEVIAMEERSIKESLVDKVSELEEQVVALREGYEGANSERDSQATLIDNLQNALREIQEARKRELREMVETTEEQVQGLKKLVQEADARATEAEAAKQSLTQELERTAPFEKEVKEKNLLIGKLRHEAIVLNDHLTKALRYLKRPSQRTMSIDKSLPTTSSTSSLSTAATPSASRSSKSWLATSTGPTSSASKPASPAPAPLTASAYPCLPSHEHLARPRSVPTSSRSHHPLGTRSRSQSYGLTS
ncbi:hypothetical protein NW754_000028 [Fusarium falciforme]|nr:hypothetical protein NW754_000028 [Fusarium falciforme]